MGMAPLTLGRGSTSRRGLSSRLVAISGADTMLSMSCHLRGPLWGHLRDGLRNHLRNYLRSCLRNRIRCRLRNSRRWHLRSHRWRSIIDAIGLVVDTKIVTGHISVRTGRPRLGPAAIAASLPRRKFCQSILCKGIVPLILDAARLPRHAGHPRPSICRGHIRRTYAHINHALSGIIGASYSRPSVRIDHETDQIQPAPPLPQKLLQHLQFLEIFNPIVLETSDQQTGILVQRPIKVIDPRITHSIPIHFQTD